MDTFHRPPPNIYYAGFSLKRWLKKMFINYEEWIKSRYGKYPVVQNALIQYWKTMHDLTKRSKPEDFHYNDGVFRSLLDCEISPLLYDNEIEGWDITFQFGKYPDEVEYRKILESAIIKILNNVPNIQMITSSVDITPFLNITPDLRLLSLHSCVSSKTLSPKIGLLSLKELHIMNFRGCFDLEQIPSEIGNLPNLRRIELESCPNIMTLPESLAKIPTLKGIILGPNPSIEYPNLTIPPCLEPYIHYRGEENYLMI